ncbi:M1 family metallopeptidase [Cyclobacteriaceae bacterium]|nr:M1 family metallopeptidase [Cyclobacteriaceae bacterium]MDB9883473.1 M1 family metallopeptidase [Cyclobacteriaceae bacterium]MDC1369094.1 M1 family metallopeptidase [Cyclobacteriaceae bacterium]
MRKRAFFLSILMMGILGVWGQTPAQWGQKFEQLGTSLPTPNTYRTASGAPGKDYWQQRADYKIELTLDDVKQQIEGTEAITYFNQSPDPLDYLWLQLDQNFRAQDSETPLVTEYFMKDSVSAKELFTIQNNFDGGFRIDKVLDEAGQPLAYFINKTMMRINLEQPLLPGAQMTFQVDWHYKINDRMSLGGRSGYEYFPKDDNYSYTIAQFYPRMAVYDDVEGWQNKQFLGRGEFALSFGNFEVAMTVPEDFIVGATGTLQNPKDVLTSKEQLRFEKAKQSFEDPVIIVTQEEAIQKEAHKKRGKATWTFKADSVRDFAFAASRKYIWDAMAVDLNGKKSLAMSYYPKEGNPLWESHSTRAVRQTLITYSRHTIDYPYPVAISVHAASVGMEYPMICFNFGRPEADGTYTDETKWRMISVIIHEVGHNFFPMIINSDERQWTWMDEGLDSFVQSIATKEYDANFPVGRGAPEQIIPYMSGEQGLLRPIMTNSEQILQFGNNAYAKPATALSILRETVMGPELFDYAFKKYAERWAFKSPAPADFFRTMEDASAIDLDWFWRGWFYTTDYVDIGVEEVKHYRMQTEEEGLEKRQISGEDKKLNTEQKRFTEEVNTFVFKNTEAKEYREFKNKFNEIEIKEGFADQNFYEVKLANKGGLVMPVIIEWSYADGSTEREKLPAEIWRKNEKEVTKVFVKSKEVVGIVIDPNKETADADTGNNQYPNVVQESRFDKFKSSKN